MAATYSDADLTDKDKVRSKLGGGNTILPAASPLLTDEHIVAVLTAEGSVAAAVAALARELIVRFAGKPTKIKAGDVEIDFASRIPEWRRLADEQSGSGGGITLVPVTYTGLSAVDEYSRTGWW